MIKEYILKYFVGLFYTFFASTLIVFFLNMMIKGGFAIGDGGLARHYPILNQFLDSMCDIAFFIAFFAFLYRVYTVIFKKIPFFQIIFDFLQVFIFILPVCLFYYFFVEAVAYILEPTQLEF